MGEFKSKKIILSSLILTLIPYVSHSETLYCERLSIDPKGFVDKEAAESWYLRDFQIQIDGERAYFLGYSNRKGVVNKNKDNGRLEITFTADGKSKSNVKLKFQRFTKGDPYLQIQQTAGFKELGKAFYKCDDNRTSTKASTSTINNDVSKSAESSENNIWEHIIDDQNGDVFIDRKKQPNYDKGKF